MLRTNRSDKDGNDILRLESRNSKSHTHTHTHQSSLLAQFFPLALITWFWPSAWISARAGSTLLGHNFPVESRARVTVC